MYQKNRKHGKREVNMKQTAKPRNRRLDILYEDKQILLVNKPAGLIVHPNDSEQNDTLITHVREYLCRKGDWNAKDPAAFRPMPCNRLDRFTSGIVIVAKTWDAMRIMNQKIQQREVEKIYQCIVIGKPRQQSGKIENYILKNQNDTLVTVHKHQVPGSQYACMLYRTVAVQNQLALLECNLITGRTHQIRAQLAWLGCSVLGDMKYGDKKYNQKVGKQHQILCATQVTFSFVTDAGVLNYLQGKTFRIKRNLQL